MQSVINYIERSRAGYAHMIVNNALASIGYRGPDCEPLQRIRNRLESYIMVAMQHADLEEPDPEEDSVQRDVAESPPAVAGGLPDEVAAEKSSVPVKSARKRS